MSQKGTAIEFLPDEGVAPARKRRAVKAPRTRKPRRAPLDIPPLALWGIGLGGVLALVALAGLVSSQHVELINDPYDPLRLVVYALLIIGPGALFWALARGMRMGLFWLYGTAALALFGYLLIFVRPPAPQQAAAIHYGEFLGALALALVAILTPPLYALGYALFSQRLRRLDLGRAVRQALLITAYVVLLIGMGLFGVFNWLNALLLFVVFALAEFFFLARS